VSLQDADTIGRVGTTRGGGAAQGRHHHAQRRPVGVLLRHHLHRGKYPLVSSTSYLCLSLIAARIGGADFASHSLVLNVKGMGCSPSRPWFHFARPGTIAPLAGTQTPLFFPDLPPRFLSFDFTTISSLSCLYRFFLISAYKVFDRTPSRCLCSVFFFF
jgi:hypothetical protein